MKRFFRWLWLPALMALFVNCQPEKPTYVAHVDGEGITIRELERAYTDFQPQNVYKLATLESLREKLDELIEDRLIVHEAYREKLPEYPDIRQAMDDERNLQLYNFAINELVYGRLFPESTLRQYYQYLHKEVRVRHIFIPLNPLAPEPLQQKVLNEIVTIRRELESGKDFSDLAKKYSRDRNSARRGGDLGFISWHPSPFEMTAFSLQKGEVSKPVRTEIGYHLLQVTGERPIIVPPYPEVRQRILNELRREKARELVGALDSTAQVLKKQYHFAMNQGNIAYVADKLRNVPRDPKQPPPAFNEIFSEEEMQLELAGFDGGQITVYDLGRNFYRLQTAQQIGSWLETTGRIRLFILEARRRGLDKDPVFVKFAEDAVNALLRKEMENRVIEVRANELAREQQKTSLRMSDWRRLKSQARREWMRELRSRHTIEIHEEALQKLLRRFQKLAE
ncbi:MAG: peptidylprolyl isomerase [candidate division KSB1 bacterium]|nr:peptidylprolyl isomerase [candidate division KSB1 bacterium]